MAIADFFLDFVIAAAVGGLVGVEREHRADNQAVVAGVRTFPLVAIAGFLVAILAAQSGSPFVLAAGVLGAFALGLMLVHARQAMGFVGFTTPAAMIVTFLVGVLIGYGHRFEGVIVGVVATFLLVTKQRLHRFAQYLDDREILSALQFITVLFILLPVTSTLASPVWGQDWLGRGAVVDPFIILTVVVFVSVISFVSLLVMRRVGPGLGLEFSGLLGGLVNSEATTASLAQRSREDARLVGAAVIGSLLASTTMLVRNLAIAAFADPSLRLFGGMLPFLVPAFLVGGVLAWRMRYEHREAIEGIRIRNPFAVGPALQFALIFAAVSIAAQFAQQTLGTTGVYVLALGGFVSAGAVVAGLASLVVTGAVPLDVAVATAVLANAASIAGKLVILRAIHAPTFKRGLVPYLAMGGVAAAGALVALLFR